MPIELTTPGPLLDAVGKLSAKTPIGSVLRSADWQKVPIALRERAQFSAGVESARVLQRVQESLLDAVSLAKEPRVESEGTKGKMDRQKFIADLQALAREEGLTPSDEQDRGTLRDITSEARLDLIFRTQMGQAHGFAWWKRGQDADVLDGWPAQELVRVRASKVPRDWKSRWSEAGGEFPGGRMVALKSDPVWTNISRFGLPYPPFDYNSGMGVQDVDREEAVGLGLISQKETKGTKVEPIEQEFNEGVEASVRGLTEPFKEALKNYFGSQIDVVGEVVKWVTQ